MDNALQTLGMAMKGMGWIFLPALALPAIYLFFGGFWKFGGISRALIRTVDSISYSFGEIIKWALPALVISITFSVFALSIFGLSWTKLSESADYFHAGVIMLGAAATLLAGQHVRVDIFHARMSPKTRALVDFSGFYLFLLPVCLVILWKSQSFTNFAWLILEGSNEADGIKGRFLLKTLIPVFAVMMLMQGLSIALRAAMTIRGEELPQRPSHTPPLFEDEPHKLLTETPS